jgi:hypothetical protein
LFGEREGVVMWWHGGTSVSILFGEREGVVMWWHGGTSPCISLGEREGVVTWWHSGGVCDIAYVPLSFEMRGWSCLVSVDDDFHQQTRHALWSLWQCCTDNHRSS